MGEIKVCPFCGEVPHYYDAHLITNMTHKEHGWDRPVISRETQNIRCDNLQCPVRPILQRIESEDAIEIWNTRYGE